VLANCNNGSFMQQGNGSAPIQTTYNSIGHTNNRCVFTVAPAALPIFNRMFVNQAGRGVNPFLHYNKTAGINLAQFGNGQNVFAAKVDRFGKYAPGGFEIAYDHMLDEGTPLYAVAGGVVISNGSRERDISVINVPGTTYQGELFIKYSVGSDPVYRESFVVYYGHVRKRLVIPFQTVKAGQIVGYVGATGATKASVNGVGMGGYAHVHSGVMRTSNINAQSSSAAYGYHPAFVATNDASGSNLGGISSTDPLGWGAPAGYDPWGYMDMDTPTVLSGVNGVGAWSINLFKSGHAFNYP
jgi:hypothetical protein